MAELRIFLPHPFGENEHPRNSDTLDVYIFRTIQEIEILWGHFLHYLFEVSFYAAPPAVRAICFAKALLYTKNAPVCGWRFEREEGYWTGAMAVNLVVTEFLVAAIVIPIAATPSIPLFILLLVGLPLSILLPFIFFRHAKSLWMSIDFLIHPVEAEEHPK